MKKRAEKGIRKRVFITIGVVLVMVLTAAGYWNINRKIPPVVVEEVKIGEQLDFYFHKKNSPFELIRRV